MTPEELLAELDVEQQAAAKALVGPVRILAGAGTGKTRTITHRLAYGIATGHFAANRAMVLTYTARAAGELRARLLRLGVGSVSVKTFHAAALAQLEYFWPQLTGAPAPKVLEGKGRLLHEIAARDKISLNADAIRELASEIEWRKQSLLSLDDYQNILKERPAISGLSAKKNLAIQASYEEEKAKNQTIDFEDVLILTLGMLRAEPAVREHVRSQYRFFTVDEYQDISRLQHELLDEWLGDHSDICVVGDPNQTIFSFTGASNSFLLGFANRYDQAQTFELRRNYRSTKQIVNFANRLTRDQGWMGPLEANDGNGPAPRIREFENAQAEANAVAQDIRTLLDSGTAAKDIAVLFRINGQSEIYENALSQLRIEYQVRGGVRYFQRSEIQAALRAIRAEASVADPEVNLYAKVSEIIRSLGWSAKMPDDSAMRDTWEALNALLEIADELGDSATLNDLSRELEDRAKSQHEPTRAAVTLATMHATKGLEWPKVYVVGLVDGLMPISFAKTEIELAEEKRLLYVAITRAEQFLQLSWAKNDTNQSTGQRSRFLTLLESPLQ